MTLVGCDLHSRKQQVAVLDTSTGEVVDQELVHEGDAVERFYRALRPPVTIGIETTGYTQWFHALMHRLGQTVLVGEAGKIRAMVIRKTATRETLGATSLSTSKRFPISSDCMEDNPVMFPPGRARLLTNPIATGSATCTIT